MTRSLTRISTQLDGIGHVLRDRRLSVPPYQRTYSWEEEEVSDFWWDLRAAFRSKASQYFLGTIVLTHDESGVTRIVDGQQRLATTSLLLAALRNEFFRRGEVSRAEVIEREYLLAPSLRSGSPEPRLQLNDEDQPNFIRAVENPGAVGPEPDDTTRIAKAVRFLEQHVSREAGEAGPHWSETLIQWAEFLELRTRVITVEVSDEADAFLIFETLNDRGRELTVADLLKNYLFGLARDDLETIQQLWLGALDGLKASADEEAFATFVRHYWSSENGATRERELYGRIKAQVTSPRSAVALARSLDEAAPPYAALLSADDPFWTRRPGSRAALDSLLRLGLEQNRPLLLAALLRFDDSEFEALLRAVLGWSVRGIIVGGIGGGSTERAYGEAAVAVSEGSAGSVADVFDALANVIPTDEAFVQAFASRRINRTKIAKYLLTALARYEAGAPEPAIVSEADDTRFTLSTVLPRAADAAAWREFPADEIGQWSQRLGNFILSDASGSPAPFAAELLSLHGASRVAWSPADVAGRQEDMAAAAVSVWPRRVAG